MGDCHRIAKLANKCFGPGHGHVAGFGWPERTASEISRFTPQAVAVAKRKNGPSPCLLLLPPPRLRRLVSSFICDQGITSFSLCWDCEAGLRCAGCDGDLGVCVSIRPYVPRSKVGDLPFNKYSWQTTHNSFADAGAHSATGATLITFTNQQYDITSQLNNVRFFALSHVHLCFRIFFPSSTELSAS
ncbi:PI-PLC X domain-containing protein [Musa troglodytarum]|uniref:PI-PLC X domain-containing protein n=1 Tax=Musa troglodytarum TaxID=320322 RepID=A0A9E7G5X3_9LILI|nr:PI-PLC X domain-containing protein [Musa troglodytarum]